MHTETDEKYGVGPRDYLQRARQLLDESKKLCLFHAAFELRCGVEAQLKEYLDAQKHISKKTKSHWEIPKPSKGVKKAFGINKPVEIEIRDKVSGELYGKFLYTPVSKELIKLEGKLGNYLHNMKKFKPANDEWWKSFRDELERTYTLLERATEGSLLGPPLLDSKTQQVSIRAKIMEGGTIKPKDQPLGRPGQKIKLVVRYLD